MMQQAADHPSDYGSCDVDHFVPETRPVSWETTIRNRVIAEPLSIREKADDEQTDKAK